MSQVAVSKTERRTPAPLVADSFSRSVVLLASLLVLQRAIGFLRSFYICGALAPSQVGQWDLALSFLLTVGPLVVLGIPGSFGRYVARYEERGYLGRFLKQTFSVSLSLTLLGAIGIYFLRQPIADVFFGNASHSDFVLLLAVGLPLVVLFHFTTSWFSGRRLNRIVFRLEFAQTAFFAAGCFAGCQWFGLNAFAVVGAYLFSCGIATLLAASYFLADRCHHVDTSDERQEESIWRKVLPFAVWIWMSNTMVNLFAVCDKMLLVNFYPDSSVDVSSLIGQYHTACIFPALLMTLGGAAGSMLIPYISADWEKGDHDAVTDRMNLILKAVGVLCVGASMGVLFVAPILFGGIWKDKFSIGESLLPMTLSYCSLVAMSYVTQKYFWCIEKTWYESAVVAVGLTANCFIGFWLIQSHGINGVVASTVMSHAIVLAGLFVLCARHGLKLDVGVYAVSIALLLVCLGKLACFIVLVCLVMLALFTDCLFSRSAKEQIVLQLQLKLAKFTS